MSSNEKQTPTSDINELQELEAQLKAAIIQGGQSGDLSPVKQLKSEIEAKIAEIKNRLGFNLSFPVTVNYDLQLKDVVNASQFNFVDSRIINFYHLKPDKTGVHTTEMSLIAFDRMLSSNDVVAELNQHNLIPANLHELLALYNSYQLDSARVVVSLSSIGLNAFNNPIVPFLKPARESDYHLETCGYDTHWYAGCYFLAITP